MKRSEERTLVEDAIVDEEATRVRPRPLAILVRG